MGRPVTLLERLCEHALSFGAQTITVEYKDHREWVFAQIDGSNVRIADFATSGQEAVQLREDLAKAARRPIRAALGGQVCVLKVHVYDCFGEDAYAVAIQPAPALDPSIAPSFTAKQGQYLAYIYNYIQIHKQAPAEADLERYFRVSAPSIHEMIKTLERNGFIKRTPGEARSIRLLVQPEHLPRLGKT
jgi:LexA DNA binding domain